MSVPVNLRNVPDTANNTKFDTIEMCSQLFFHAVKCTTSEKVQSSVFSFLASMILQQSLEIYLNAYEANTVPFYKGKVTQEQYETRRRLILQAMRGCSNLQGLVTLGKRSFSWRNKKIYYWVNMVISTREMLSKWLGWCENEYKG